MLKESPASPIEFVVQGRNEFYKSKALCQAFSSAEFEETPSYAICISGIQSPIGNAVLQRHQPLTDEIEVSSILERFNKKQLPFFWWEAPIPIKNENQQRTQTHAIGETLAQKGFHPAGLLTGVVADLDSQIPIQLQNKGITIRKIKTAEELSLFCQFVFSLTGMEPIVIEQAHTLLKSDQGHDTHFLAFDGNQPVGSITLAMGQTAGLWNLTTLPDRQNHGIGTALIQTALQDAHLRGYEKIMAILRPNEKERTLWTRLRFQEVCHFPFHISPGLSITQSSLLFLRTACEDTRSHMRSTLFITIIYFSRRYYN